MFRGLIFTAILFCTAAAFAGEPLRITSDKNALVRLDHDAASVVINNPNTASVMLDSPRLLIVVPHQPGATSFTVLDAKGEVVLQKDILVTNVQPQYVRIRRMCAGNDASCAPAAYYYCPDGCYEVPTLPNSGNGTTPPPAAAANTAINAAAGMAGQSAPQPPQTQQTPEPLANDTAISPQEEAR